MNTVYEFGDGRKTAMPSDDLMDVDIEDYMGNPLGMWVEPQHGGAESALPYPEDAHDPAFAETGWTARRKQADSSKFVHRPIEGFVAGDKFINRWRQVVTIREIKRNENGEFVVFIEEEDIWPFPLYYKAGETLKTFANASYKSSARKQAERWVRADDVRAGDEIDVTTLDPDATTDDEPYWTVTKVMKDQGSIVSIEIDATNPASEDSNIVFDVFHDQEVRVISDRYDEYGSSEPMSARRASRKQASVPTLTYLSDPGHGWLGVPIDLFPDAPSFSTGYSYYDSKTNTIWLEEDQEAPAFKRAHEGEFGIVEKNEPFDDAWVRSLPVMQITPVASRSNKGNAVSKLSPSEAARLRKFRATVQRNAPKVAFEWPKELGRTEDGITVSQHRASGAIQVDYLGDRDDDYLRSMTYFGYTIEEAIDLFREELGLPDAGYIAMQFGASKRRGSRKHSNYNGWANHATWNVALWLQNDEGLYGMVQDYPDYETLADLLRSELGVYETPDGVSFHDSALDIDALNEIFEELHSEGSRRRASRRPADKSASRRRVTRKTAYGDGLDVRMLMVDLDRSDIRDYIEEQEISGFNASSYKSALVDFVLSKATSNEDAIKRANAALNDMALVGYDSANEIQAEVYDYLKENGIDDEWDRLRGEWKAHLRQARTASRRGGSRRPARKRAALMPFDIVAYTYKADVYMPEDLIERLIADGIASPGARGMYVEEVLDQIAGANAIDRDDESSFDSDEFPKVVFRDQFDDDQFYFDGRESRRRNSRTMSSRRKSRRH